MLIAAVATVRAPAMWKGDALKRVSIRPLLPMRAVPASLPFLWCVVIFLVIEKSTHQKGSLFRASAWAFAVVALIDVFLVGSVALFARPRWAIPPALRNEPGALSGREGSRR